MPLIQGDIEQRLLQALMPEGSGTIDRNGNVHNEVYQIASFPSKAFDQSGEHVGFKLHNKDFSLPVAAVADTSIGNMAVSDNLKQPLFTVESCRFVQFFHNGQHALLAHLEDARSEDDNLVCNGAAIWGLAQKSCLHTISFTEPIQNPSLAMGGALLCGHTRNRYEDEDGDDYVELGPISIWNMKTGGKAILPLGQKRFAHGYQLSPDETAIAFFHNDDISPEANPYAQARLSLIGV